MMARKRVRIGFIGAGKMGQCAHLCNYTAISECTVAALAEIKPELGRRVTKRYKVPRVYTDYHKMLANEDIDGIVASQPFTRHQILLTDLAKSKLPVFIEKPLARSVEAGEAILKALEENPTGKTGGNLMVGYHKLSDPATVYVKKEIARFFKKEEIYEVKSWLWLTGSRWMDKC